MHWPNIRECVPFVAHNWMRCGALGYLTKNVDTISADYSEWG